MNAKTDSTECKCMRICDNSCTYLSQIIYYRISSIPFKSKVSACNFLNHNEVLLVYTIST